MWETINTLITYLLSQGGAWGVLIIILLSWAGYREWSYIKSGKNLIDKEKEIINELVNENKKIIDNIIIEHKTNIKEYIESTEDMFTAFGKKQDAFSKLLKEYSKKAEDFHKELLFLQERIDDVTKNIDTVVNINEKNNNRIAELDEKLELTNDKRIKELKELLYSYNKTIQELSITLSKIKFILQTKIDVNSDDI
jgi:chromosome segregation ATPase